jgi:hypothetical protein
VDLYEALSVFDAAETASARLEGLWSRMESLIPQAPVFYTESSEGIEYDGLARSSRELVAGLPTVDGYVVGDALTMSSPL